MFLKKKKKCTNSLTKEEALRVKEIWCIFIMYTKLTEEEFLRVWDTGTDMVPMAFAISYASSEMDC